VTAALRRVRGVQSASVDRRRDEATVIRLQGQASNQELVAAVRRVGYSASMIPVKNVTLSVSNMDRQGASERVRAALTRVPGVREVSVSGRNVAKVSYDNRRTDQNGLIRACQRAGFPATASATTAQPTRTRTVTVRSTPVRRTSPTTR
jgi:copper chaperone CopZ